MHPNDVQRAEAATELLLFGEAMEAAADAFSDTAWRQRRVVARGEYLDLLVGIGAAMGVCVAIWHHHEPTRHYIDVEYRRCGRQADGRFVR